MSLLVENEEAESPYGIEGSPGGPYTVERIVGIFYGKKDKKHYYKIRWADSWEPEENLSEGCERLIEEFWAGNTLDESGNEVKKADIKAGQKVIKQEVHETSPLLSPLTDSSKLKTNMRTLVETNGNNIPTVSQLQNQFPNDLQTNNSVKRGSLIPLSSLSFIPLERFEVKKQSSPTTKEDIIDKKDIFENGKLPKLPEQEISNTSLVSNCMPTLVSNQEGAIDSVKIPMIKNKTPASTQQSIPASDHRITSTQNVIDSGVEESTLSSQTQNSFVSRSDEQVKALMLQPIGENHDLKHNLFDQQESSNVYAALKNASPEIGPCSSTSEEVHTVSTQTPEKGIETNENDFASNFIEKVHMDSNNFIDSNSKSTITKYLCSISSASTQSNEDYVNADFSNEVEEMENGISILDNVNCSVGDVLPRINNVVHTIDVEDDEVIDIEESDNELEIVGSITTPKRKRGRPPGIKRIPNISPIQSLNNMGSNNTQQTPPFRNNYVARTCQTNPDLSARSCVSRIPLRRATSDERPPNLSNPTMPMHPRRLLCYSSHDSDSDDFQKSRQSMQQTTLPRRKRRLQQFSREQPVQQNEQNLSQQTQNFSQLQQFAQLRQQQNQLLQQNQQPQVQNSPQQNGSFTLQSSLTRSQASKTRISKLRDIAKQQRMNVVLPNNGAQTTKIDSERISYLESPEITNTESTDSPSKYLSGRTCNICCHTFPNLTLARQHANLSHSDKQATKSTSVCNICNGIFPNPRDLKSHMLLHGDTSKLHKCEVCLRTFKHRSVLEQHMLLHSGDMPYSCGICEKRFRQQGHLITHMAQHENHNSPLTCPRCALDFANPIIYAAHQALHEKELKFHCRLCQEGFKEKATLILHLEGHNEDRPFFCHICQKSFKTKTYLTGHIQMHKASAISNVEL